MKKMLITTLVVVFIVTVAFVTEVTNKITASVTTATYKETNTTDLVETTMLNSDFIKWVDFNAGTKILKKLLSYAVQFNSTEMQFDFADALAYLATKNGNNFNEKSDLANLEKLIAEIKNDKSIEDFYGENKYYKYYKEAYHAIFDGLIGNYTQVDGINSQFGVKGYFPIAEGFWFNHYDDFGNSRSYGFKRKHLGHDIMGAVGTPIVAVEGGTIAELGWNQYGGWRVGIRSLDGKRYYYYAHLRKDIPFAQDLVKGATVNAGEVIGYLGRTGYSTTENVNLKNCDPHLHFGMQLIFDESQVSGNNEIWIDVYSICNLLLQSRAKVERIEDTKHWQSTSIKLNK